MNRGVGLCVLMAVLAAGALTQPVPPGEPAGSGLQRAEEAPRRQLRAVQRTDGESRAHLGVLLARYIQQARKEGGPLMSCGPEESGFDQFHASDANPYSMSVLGNGGIYRRKTPTHKTEEKAGRLRKIQASP
ncbi:hypothetical protein P7K49_031310 [Saguinus oedipus]|uniref:Gastrin/cholecystokinin peptide hormone domain-containing protein n=1 Tax=Saguinus oedipus TaxID=9490 RepID=A0ABQ9TZV3_SAGOE|nr:hypothetical protein P7K49_031310 [Saguinus oedipus]